MLKYDVMSYCAWAAFINTSYYFTGHKEHTMGLSSEGEEFLIFCA